MHTLYICYFSKAAEMDSFSHLGTLFSNLGAVYACEELGSFAWKASNTLCILHVGIFHCGIGVFLVEEQQLSNNSDSDEITNNVFKSIPTWV